MLKSSHLFFIAGFHSHPVVVHKLLRKVVDHTLDAAPVALGAARFPRLYLASDLMAFAFRACMSSKRSIHRIQSTPPRNQALTCTRFGYPRRWRSSVQDGRRTTGLSRGRIEASIVGRAFDGCGVHGHSRGWAIGDAPVTMQPGTRTLSSWLLVRIWPPGGDSTAPMQE